LRALSNFIEKMKHPFSAEHKAILASTCVAFVEKADSASVAQVDSINNYTLTVALTKYVAKATELKSYDLSVLRGGYKNTSQDVSARLVRLLKFMIDNGKGTLAYYVDQTQKLFFEEARDEIAARARVILIAIIVDPIIILLLMVLFIPFILKVQSSLLKIYIHLCQFKDTEIREWLDACNNSACYIKASISRMRKIYGSTSFEVNFARAAEEKANENKNKTPDKKAKEAPHAQKEEEKEKEKEKDKGTQQTTLNTTQKTTDAAMLSAETEGDDTAAILKTQEEAVSERKQRMFSRMTKDKTKAYLLYLLFFAVYIGIFRIADGLVFSNLSSEADARKQIFTTLSEREHAFVRTALYFREDLVDNRVTSYFSGEDVFVRAHRVRRHPILHRQGL
jgi:hypothetical protein